MCAQHPQQLSQTHLQIHNHTTQFLRVGIYARYRAALSSPTSTTSSIPASHNAESTDASTSSPTPRSDHNTRLGLDDWPTSSSGQSDSHSSCLPTRQQSYMDGYDFGHGWQSQYLEWGCGPERPGNEPGSQAADDSVESEIRYRRVLGGRQDVLPRGRDQVLSEARGRALPCSAPAGAVGIHDLQGELSGSPLCLDTP